MNLTLNTEAIKFIEEQVHAGYFPSTDAVIEAAIADMHDCGVELNEEDLAAIREADEQAERGEGMEFSEFRANLAKRFPRVR